MTVGELAAMLGMDVAALIEHMAPLRLVNPTADTILSRSEIAQVQASFGLSPATMGSPAPTSAPTPGASADSVSSPSAWNPATAAIPLPPLPRHRRKASRGILKWVISAGVVTVVSLLGTSLVFGVPVALGQHDPGPGHEPAGPFGMRAPLPSPLPATAPISAKVAARLTHSTALVVGGPCTNNVDMNGGYLGSGWVIAPDLVATNAHVAIRLQRVWVYFDDGTMRTGKVVAFSPGMDVAIIRIPKLNRQPLTMADPTPGEAGLSFGHIGGGPLDYHPFVYQRSGLMSQRDIEGISEVNRPTVYAVGSVGNGDSGSAMINAKGQVIGMVWGSGDDGQIYGVGLSAIKQVLATASPHEVPHGNC